jgi:hypothetical protein
MPLGVSTKYLAGIILSSFLLLDITSNTSPANTPAAGKIIPQVKPVFMKLRLDTSPLRLPQRGRDSFDCEPDLQFPFEPDITKLLFDKTTNKVTKFPLFLQSQNFYTNASMKTNVFLPFAYLDDISNFTIASIGEMSLFNTCL